MINDIVMPYHDERELPTFTLRQIDLPDILKWQVNGKYYLVMKVEMVGMRNMKDLSAPEDRAKMEADFQILSIKPAEDYDVDTESVEKQEFNEFSARVKSGGF